MPDLGPIGTSAVDTFGVPASNLVDGSGPMDQPAVIDAQGWQQWPVGVTVSSTLVDIAHALETAARDALTQPPVSLAAARVAWPDVPFDPPADAEWAKVDLLWAPTSPETVGENGLTRHAGILQILVHRPRGGGGGRARELAQEILNRFKRGTRLNRNLVSVLVERSSVGPPLIDGAWSVLPVSINWSVRVQD